MSELKQPNKAVADPSAAPVTSQAEIDAESSRIRLESEKLKLKREILELEKLTSDIESIRAKKSSRETASQNVQDSLAYQMEDRARNEEGCTHAKGGSSEDLLNGAVSRGNDYTNYAMIEHTLMSGCKFRLCQRCGRTWFPMDPDYKWAMSRPSKNTPSTSCINPGLIKNRGPVEAGGQRMVSEIPHKNVAQPQDRSAAWSPEDNL